MPQIPKPLSLEALTASLDRSETIIADLENLRNKSNLPEMDQLDLELFGEALSPLRTTEQVAKVRAEIRRSCEFCPTAKRVTEIVAAAIGRSQDTIPAHYADTRKILDRCNADREGRQNLLEGVTPEKAAENRDRARNLIASLAAKSGLDAAKTPRKFGEAPDFLKGELEQLAARRAAIEQMVGHSDAPATASRITTARSVRRVTR